MNASDRSPAMEHPGLTKRELFAVMALQGLLSRSTYSHPETVACDAVECADRLIAALAEMTP